MLNQAPTGYTEHVRDPKPFITEEGKIRFILGAQREDLSGTALIYEMTDLDATPQLIGEFKLPDFDNQQVFMWECPDLLKLQEQDLFLWSPQGKAQNLLFPKSLPCHLCAGSICQFALFRTAYRRTGLWL